MPLVHHLIIFWATPVSFPVNKKKKKKKAGCIKVTLS